MVDAGFHHRCVRRHQAGRQEDRQTIIIILPASKQAGRSVGASAIGRMLAVTVLPQIMLLMTLWYVLFLVRAYDACRFIPRTQSRRRD